MATDTRVRILDAAQRFVMRDGYTATTVDGILDEVGVSKGAFFHHFPTKAALGEALVSRYADADLELLDGLIADAERRYDDPVARVIALFRSFEDLVRGSAEPQPGCLFVSFIFDVVPDRTEIRELVEQSVAGWRSRILALLEAAAAVRPPSRDVDLKSLADQAFTTFEGGFVLVRATGDTGALASQLAHLRTYVELLFSD